MNIFHCREATNLANAGHLAAAIMEISCAIELDSTNLAYYNRRRSWYEELGILDKYIDDCKKILRLDGGADPYVFCDLIKALMQITEITGEKYAVLDLDEVLAEGLQLFPQHSELVKLRERRQDQVRRIYFSRQHALTFSFCRKLLRKVKSHLKLGVRMS